MLRQEDCELGISLGQVRQSLKKQGGAEQGLGLSPQHSPRALGRPRFPSQGHMSQLLGHAPSASQLSGGGGKRTGRAIEEFEASLGYMTPCFEK